ncbi:MAG: enoyl-CoA hydratase/isomerase family protein [Deltaproteobacteria bacterium]|nr:enoyl-CoA hydratase/isomerase family protein [Deltaproteobacteria bacterium]
MDNFETIRVEQVGEVLTVSLNRPKLNLFNDRMMEELIQVWHGLRRNETARFVVLTAVGEHFSGGVDLKEVFERRFTPESARRQQLAGHELMRSLESVEQVTVAALRGAVVGAGMAVAQACDFRIMTENSYYLVPETQIGTYYTWGCTPRLVRMVGASRAMEIVMTCDPVPAEDAFRLNLANRVVPDDALEETTREFVEKIAARSPTCIRLTKKIALGASMEGFGNMLAVEPELMQGVVYTGESEERIRAFLEQRAPRYGKG